MPTQEGEISLMANTGFLTQAPMTTMIGGFRPRTVSNFEASMGRSRSLTESPFLFRRSKSACGELPSIGITNRAKSARYAYRGPIIMPRSHVSVARFYDWSGDVGDCFSVSSLYREIANSSQTTSTQTQGQNKNRINLSLNFVEGSGTNVPVLSNASSNRPPFNSPGRMFVRDKKALTRGEREIIEGIYKNRSDLNSKEAITKVDFQVKSHQEAWQAGKICMKNERLDGKQMMKSNSQNQKQLSEYVCNDDSNTEILKTQTNTMASNSDNTNKNASSKHSNRLSRKTDTSPRPQCSQCFLEQRGLASQDLAKRAYLTQNQDGYWDSRPCAPPSTPDRITNNNEYFSAGRSLSFDKLLSTKPNHGACMTSHVTLVDSNSSLGENSYIDIKNGKTLHQHHGLKEAGKTPRDTNKIQKTLEAIQTVLDENGKLHHKQNSSSSGFHSEVNPELDNDLQYETNSNSENSSISESGSKKVKVKVYLPIAQCDVTAEDDISETGIVTPSVFGDLTADKSSHHRQLKRKD